MTSYKIILPLALCLLVSCQKQSNDSGAPTAASLSSLGRSAGWIPEGKLLSPAARLRKLSLHLRGITPTAAEYEGLTLAIPQGQSEIFFQRTIPEYLKSPQHIGKMIDRLDELFRLKTTTGLPETRYSLPAEMDPRILPGSETVNSLDLLFEDLVKNNQSWDSLLTSKTYRIPVPQLIINDPITDHLYFSAVAPDLQPPTASDKFKYVLLPLSEGDVRVAGALTTARFFRRYNTTVLNRNRGRAAAVFRIFLCDDMRAVVTPAAGEEAELLKKAFPPPHPRFSYHEDIRVEDKHAKDPACIACHYKLDPLGKTFMTSGTTSF